MDNTSLFLQLAGVLKGCVLLALLLHALALVPQWRARYFNPRFLNLTLTGLLLGVVHGCVIALAQRELASGAGRDVVIAWALTLGGMLNIALAAQNLLAVLALVHLHRPSAIVAQRLRPAVTPMMWVSAGLAVVAYFAI
jgi:hypothetical protein